jgi:hypothetical protein
VRARAEALVKRARRAAVRVSARAAAAATTAAAAVGRRRAMLLRGCVGRLGVAV